MDKKEMKELLLEHEKRIDKKFENIDKKFDNIDKKFVKQTKDIHDEMYRMGGTLIEKFQSDLRIVAEVQGEHSKKLDAITDMVAQNTVDIDIMKGMLRRKIDIDEFGVLEKRVMVLEKKMRVG